MLDGNKNADQTAAILPFGIGNTGGIDFQNSDLTDSGLALLTRFVRLNHLIVKNTKVSRQGVEAFKRQVPGCVVVSDFGRFEYEHRLPQKPKPAK